VSGDRLSDCPSAFLGVLGVGISIEDARRIFGLDENWRPSIYTENDFEGMGDVIIDRATNLMWQRSGSKVYLTYVKAQEYVEEINRQKFASYNDWRLPTIPELMSLLEPEKQSNDLYIDPVFNAKQRWCWSADCYPVGEESLSKSAWLVSFGNSNVYRSYLLKHYVRVVRSI